MKSDNIVWIKGEAYSMNHRKVKAQSTNDLSAGGGARSNVTPVGQLTAQPARAFVSTDEAKLNKTERKFLAFLRDNTLDDYWVGVQALTFKLADDCRYTPDFVVYADGVWKAYEVKGFWRDDAKVKIKVAARMFPIRFVVVQLIKGQWQFTEVKP